MKEGHKIEHQGPLQGMIGEAGVYISIGSPEGSLLIVWAIGSPEGSPAVWRLLEFPQRYAKK